MNKAFGRSGMGVTNLNRNQINYDNEELEVINQAQRFRNRNEDNRVKDMEIIEEEPEFINIKIDARKPL